MDKHGQGTHCIKIGADSLAENTPNAPEFICPICLPKPKSSEFQWKTASFGVHSPWLEGSSELKNQMRLQNSLILLLAAKVVVVP